jgi:hypothetical protein
MKSQTLYLVNLAITQFLTIFILINIIILFTEKNKIKKK